MVVPMAMVLGLACTFYIYVAIRWYREILAIRREQRRASSAMALVSGHSYGWQPQARAMVDEGREVIVMGRTKAAKHQKQEVA
jgi:hypothetical protein